jgi:two-component system response regulator RegX3
MKPRILLADDEPDILATIAYALRAEGFDVDCVEDGEAAVEAVAAHDYDVIVLDVLMPIVPGTEACRRIRAASGVPIIMLTAKDSELDRVLGLELGADDYVTKPFSMAELVSRVRAILRRRNIDRNASEATVRSIGDMRIDLVRHKVSIAGAVVPLTRSEFSLLAYLASEPERVFTRRQILEHLWETPYVGNERACDAHVSNLRSKIEQDPTHPTRLLTIREVGYTLAAA